MPYDESKDWAAVRQLRQTIAAYGNWHDKVLASQAAQDHPDSPRMQLNIMEGIARNIPEVEIQ